MQAGEASNQQEKQKLCGSVLSLGFQEGTQDARVMKQARALAEAGYDVHLFCDWLKGFPQTELVDGVLVSRFACFDHSEANIETLNSLDFLREALPFVQEKYGPFIKSCESRRWVEENFGLGFFKSFYKQARGFTRIKRKAQYIFNRRLLSFWALFETDLKELKLKLADADAGQAMVLEMDQCRAILYLDNLLRQRIECKPDIIHAHDIYTLVAGVALARKFGAKLVYDAHEYEPCRFAYDDTDDRAQLPMTLENDCFPYVNALVTVSKSILKLYEKRFFNHASVVIANAPEIGEPLDRLPGSQDNISIRKRTLLGDNDKIIVFTGMVQREGRGVDKVIQALEYLSGYYLAVMGPRQEKDDSWLLSAAKSSGVSDRIFLLDPVNARDVPVAIESCNAAVVPFQAEGLNHSLAMPNKLFEAAFAGVPLCVSDLPEMRGFVESLGIGRVMDQADPQSIAEAILEVCENPERYAPSQEIRKRLQQEYSWAAQKKKLLALYNEVLYPED